MAYNTFTNEGEKSIVLIDIDKQCIICLEKTSINEKDTVTLMNDMHFLIKKCDCICYAHHKCLEKWMSTNPVCPICKREISFPVMEIKHTELSIYIPGIQSNYGIQSNGIQSNGIQSNGIQSNGIQSNGIQSNGIQSNGIQSNGIQRNGTIENNMGSSHFCIRMTILVFFILIILQIICRN